MILLCPHKQAANFWGVPMTKTGKKMNEEINENSLEYAKQFKPYLCFDLGDVVFHKSDRSKKTPMTIDEIFPFAESCDYRIHRLSSHKNRESTWF